MQAIDRSVLCTFLIGVPCILTFDHREIERHKAVYAVLILIEAPGKKVIGLLLSFPQISKEQQLNKEMISFAFQL